MKLVKKCMVFCMIVLFMILPSFNVFAITTKTPQVTPQVIPQDRELGMNLPDGGSAIGEKDAAWKQDTLQEEKKKNKNASSIDDILKILYPDNTYKDNEGLKKILYAHNGKKNIKKWVDSYNNNGSTADLSAAIQDAQEAIEAGKTAVVDTTDIDINSSTSIAVGEIYEKLEEEEYIIEGYDSAPGELEIALSELVVGVANGVNALVNSCGASLDRLIYGRLIHYGNNYYCFELVKGNPYGIVGSHVYNIFRNIAVPFVLLMVLMRFAKSAWNGGSGEQRRVFKESIGRCIVVLLLLFLMSNIIDLLIYIKDVIMHYISSKMATDMSVLYGMDPNTTTLIGYYKNISESGHFLDAALYLGVSFITVFYMVTYIATAIAMLVNFMFFPLLSIFSFSDNKLLDTWFKQALGNIYVPLIDSVLLLMPLMLNHLTGDGNVRAYFITFIATFTVIPSRAIIRNMLGVGSGGMSELLGFGALMGTMRMLGQIKRRAGKGWEGLKELNNVRKENNELANMYGDLAWANGEGGQLTGRFAKLGKGVKRLNSIDDDGDKNENGLGGMQGKEDDKTNEERDREKLTNPKGEDGANNHPLDSVEGDEENEGQGIDAPNTGEDNKPLDSIGENGEDEETLNGVGNPEEGKVLNSVTGDSATNEGEIEGTGTGSLSPEEQQVVDKHNNLKQQAVDKNNILKGYANVDNFQNKEFANAFNFAERARLHKQNANRAGMHMITNAVGGTLGGAAFGAIGATVASSAAMFMGPQVNMTVASAGANLGSALGSKTGSYASEKIANVAMSDTVQRVVSPIKHKGLSMAAGAAGSVVNTVRPDSSATQRLNTYSEEQRQIANNGYDGYYSYNANFDESQTTANPSNLSNYGNYNQDAADRELERVRRQMEFEQKRMYQEGRLQRESQPVYDELPDVTNISEVYDALNMNHEVASQIDEMVKAFVYQEGDYYEKLQKEYDNMQANLDENDPNFKRTSFGHAVTAISNMFLTSNNVPNTFKERRANAELQEKYKSLIYKEIKKKYSNEKSIALRNRKK